MEHNLQRGVPCAAPGPGCCSSPRQPSAAARPPWRAAATSRAIQVQVATAMGFRQHLPGCAARPCSTPAVETVAPAVAAQRPWTPARSRRKSAALVWPRSAAPRSSARTTTRAAPASSAGTSTHRASRWTTRPTGPAEAPAIAPPGYSCFACPQGTWVCVWPCQADADCPTSAIPRAGLHRRRMRHVGGLPGRLRVRTALPCANRACTDDCDCDGYCVGGFCTARPGTCNLTQLTRSRNLAKTLSGPCERGSGANRPATSGTALSHTTAAELRRGGRRLAPSRAKIPAGMTGKLRRPGGAGDEHARSGLAGVASILWSSAALTSGMAMGCGSEAVVEPDASARERQRQARSSPRPDCACRDTPEPNTSCGREAMPRSASTRTSWGAQRCMGVSGEAGTTPRMNLSRRGDRRQHVLVRPMATSMTKPSTPAEPGSGRARGRVRGHRGDPVSTIALSSASRA